MLAFDVQELVNAINADRAAAGLPAFAWTDPTISSGARIRAYHFTQMRDAIQGLWNSRSMGPLPQWRSAVYPNGGVGIGKRIYGSDLNDLRYWLNQYEVTSYSVLSLPASTQGMDTFSYDPTHTNDQGQLIRCIIDQSWEDRINGPARLSHYQNIWVRCNVVATPAGEFGPNETSRYTNAFSVYNPDPDNRKTRIFALFAPEFRPRVPGVLEPTATLDPGSFSNAYIADFAARAGYAAQAFGNRVKDFIIWNEPNDEPNPDKYLPPAHFAALMHHCCGYIKAVMPQGQVNIYWGGVVFGPADYLDPQTPDQNALSYMNQVYLALKAGLPDIYDVSAPPWPWAGANVHFHLNTNELPPGPQWRRPMGWYTNLFSTDWSGDTRLNLPKISDNHNDPDSYAHILIGEWGIVEAEILQDPNCLRDMFGKIDGRLGIECMFLFKHPIYQQGPGMQWGIQDFYYPTVDLQPYVPRNQWSSLYTPYVNILNGEP